MPAYHLLEATMKKIASLVGVLMALSAGSAMAAGINLAWTDCLGAGGTVDKVQACSNSAIVNNSAFVSFVTPTAIGNMGGTSGYVDVQTSTAMGTWWLGGATRWGGSAGASTCPAWYELAPNGPVPFGPDIRQTSANRLRLRVDVAVAAGEEQAINADGTEYHSHFIQLKFNAGTFNNAECLAGAALGAPYLELFPATGTTTKLESPDVSNCITWRGGGGQVCPGATPVKKATWGSIKALYR
jgi:hypothetical protein